MLSARSLRTRAARSARKETFTVAVATAVDRDEIYRLRHEVYARELGQHQPNGTATLRDSLDCFNIYLVVRFSGRIAGFISITPPGGSTYSIDKYFTRESLPFSVHDRLYEIRLLTVLKKHRGSEVATLLMYAAFRWVEAHGGSHIIALGRQEVLELYLKVGLQPAGMSARQGAVTYNLLHAATSEVRAALSPFHGTLARLQDKVNWQLNFDFYRPAECFHGGAFFKAVGEQFDHLDRAATIINADVLDAWFPPSPRVVVALERHLPWLLRTSPPTGCEGLVETIANARGLHTINVLPGAGSSDLIFRAFCRWLTKDSHALILDPTYGEYAHVLEQVIGCTVDRLQLARKNHYDVDLDRLRNSFRDGYDLVVLVNPNSPTGRQIPRALLESILQDAPATTRVWIDETYVDYVGPAESLERFATQTENVIVCKSMSKVFGLSGARVAYLCAAAHQLESLRAITPPWVVSLPGQVAAVNALRDPEYYSALHAKTAELREELKEALEARGWDVVPGVANFLLCHLPESGPTAAEVVRACREQGLFLRDASSMGSNLGRHAIRVAVKDAGTNARMLAILGKCAFR